MLEKVLNTTEDVIVRLWIVLQRLTVIGWILSSLFVIFTSNVSFWDTAGIIALMAIVMLVTLGLTMLAIGTVWISIRWILTGRIKEV